MRFSRFSLINFFYKIYEKTRVDFLDIILLGITQIFPLEKHYFYLKLLKTIKKKYISFFKRLISRNN